MQIVDYNQVCADCFVYLVSWGSNWDERLSFKINSWIIKDATWEVRFLITLACALDNSGIFLKVVGTSWILN